MARWANSFLKKRPRGVLWMMCLALVAITGLLDYITGYDLSLSLLYLGPVALLAWYDAGITAYLAAGLSALIWLLANTAAAPGRLSPTLALWNTAIRLGFFVIVANLLASLRIAHETQRELARVDSLTGKFNSRTFREMLEVELLRAHRLSYPLSMIYLDLDNFKSLNDRRGHSRGDALLQAVGHGLTENLRATDVAGRLGGDEFAVVLPDTDHEQAAVVAAKVHTLLDQLAKAADPDVSLSMGVITNLSDVPRPEALIAAADSLMYEAKKGGKNAICNGLYSPLG